MHTKGPWHIGMKPGPIIYGEVGEQIADMSSSMLERDEHIANARLIAAAPELLEAAQKAVALMAAAGTGYAKTELRAAIAKATQG